MSHDKVLEIIANIIRVNLKIKSEFKVLFSGKSKSENKVVASIMQLRSEKRALVSRLKGVSLVAKSGVAYGLTEKKHYILLDAIKTARLFHRNSFYYVIVLDDFGVPNEFSLSNFSISI